MARKTTGSFQEQFNKVVAEQGFRAAATVRYRDYSNLAPNISGRPGLTQEDYYYHRPDELPAQTYKDIFKQCDIVYQKDGLVWNVINLMTDFTIKGIRLVHRTKRIEGVYQDWFQRINGSQVSERFINYLYRLGNVIAQRYTAQISGDDQIAVAADIKGLPKSFEPRKNEIPWKYVFLHPALCENIGGALSSFTDTPLYGVKMSSDLIKTIKFPKDDAERKIVEQLPKEIIEAASTAEQIYLLNKERTIVYHFKKDDWAPWGNPIIRPILQDLIILNKLKLADMCALDGVASKIRGWKIGSFEHNIAPTLEASKLLSSIFENNVGGGTIDFVWGPDLELIETQSDGYNFLGAEKYEPTLNAIYTGLGIPPTLTASFSASGTTNNYISLKTLTERLEYGRTLLVDFWEREVAIFQKAMGYRFPAEIEFDQPILSNEDTEKQLLIQLADRNLISDELLQRRFGMKPNMEKIRLNREASEREKGNRVKKAGQWFDPQVIEKMKLTLLQQKSVTPSQVGLELPNPKQSEIDNMHKLEPKSATDTKKNPGQSGQGRPSGKKDAQKRKQKKFTPRSKAAISAWFRSCQNQIVDIMSPVLLKYFGKANLRQLTTKEFELAEELKFNILCGLSPMEELTVDTVIAALSSNLRYETHINHVNAAIKDYRAAIGKEPTIDDVRAIQSQVYLELLQ